MQYGRSIPSEYIKKSFKVLVTDSIIHSKICQRLREIVLFVYFKYSRKTSGESMKKALANPGFFKL